MEKEGEAKHAKEYLAVGYPQIEKENYAVFCTLMTGRLRYSRLWCCEKLS